jgi:predicted nuclease of predicted toxin-antitoxin system
MRFLLDMNISPVIGEALRQDGHEVVHSRELGLAAQPDHAVLARAVADSRILITFDLDFGDIAGSVASGGSGIMLLRLRSPRLSHMLDRVRQAIATAGAPLQAGAIVLVEDARLRIRLLDASG